MSGNTPITKTPEPAFTRGAKKARWVAFLSGVPFMALATYALLSMSGNQRWILAAAGATLGAAIWAVGVICGMFGDSIARDEFADQKSQ
jgi:hypothetical protein